MTNAMTARTAICLAVPPRYCEITVLINLVERLAEPQRHSQRSARLARAGRAVEAEDGPAVLWLELADASHGFEVGTTLNGAQPGGDSLNRALLPTQRHGVVTRGSASLSTRCQRSKKTKHSTLCSLAPLPFLVLLRHLRSAAGRNGSVPQGTVR